MSDVDQTIYYIYGHGKNRSATKKINKPQGDLQFLSNQATY